MKAVVLYADISTKTKAKEVASAIARGIQQQGIDCDLLDVKKESDKRVAMYQYIAIVTTPAGLWGGSIDPSIQLYLKQNSAVAGKRCAAFVTKGAVRMNKTLQALFKVMEGEGMYLTYSDILANASQAQATGAHLSLE